MQMGVARQKQNAEGGSEAKKSLRTTDLPGQSRQHNLKLKTELQDVLQLSPW